MKHEGSLGLAGDVISVGEYRSTATELLDLLRRPAWQADALCREHPELNWFVEIGGKAAKAICASCLVRQECLTHAMAEPNLTGIWGALTTRERNLRRRAISTTGQQDGLTATA